MQPLLNIALYILVKHIPLETYDIRLLNIFL